MILNPTTADFLDRVLHDQNLEIWFQEVKIPKHSKISNKTIQELNLHKKTGVIVLAIKRANEAFELTPDSGTELHSEDILICLGTKEQIAKLKKLF